jgi:hypothetical protein
MPIIENDPWRQQYFHGVACPEDVVIPTDDALAYTLYPARRWIYNFDFRADANGHCKLLDVNPNPAWC